MLPIQTTAEDVRGVVKYLKNKPTGATHSEMKAAVSKLTDARKLTAYTFWRIVIKESEKYRLDHRGWELARKPQEEQAIFRAVIDGIVPYHSAIEWIHHQNMDMVTNNDVAAHWHEHHLAEVGKSNETTMKDSAVCFFHLCQAAGFGTLKIGRRGQATRLEIQKSELEKHIEAGPSAPPVDEPPEDSDVASETVRSESDEALPQPPSAFKPEPKQSEESIRVFIAHGKNMKIVEQVQTMLQLATVESEVAEEEETAAIPVPEKVFGAMHRCNAAVIIVSAEEGRKDARGKHLLNENVLIEIGAAFVLYVRRVILLWDKRLDIPSNLQGLYRCEYEGEELSWSAGMKLMKGLGDFKKKKSG